MLAARRQAIFLIVILPLILSLTVTVRASEPNVALLRVDSFRTPRQVGPNNVFPVSIDAEYALYGIPDNASIRAAIYTGAVDGTPLWQSDPVFVHGGGDYIWQVNLTSPTTEGNLTLTAYAFYFEEGTWHFYDNSTNGPGYREATIKIAKNATLNIDLGIPNAPVSIANSLITTSYSGNATETLAVGESYIVSVPGTLDLGNGTRVVFAGWNDGNNETQRNVSLNGDETLAGSYKTQYLLQVNSQASSYTQWYDSGSTALVAAPTSGSISWPLSLFGIKSYFMRWSGDINSPATQVNVTMNAPKTLNANYVVDSASLVMPSIFAVGVLVAVVFAVFIRTRKATGERAVEETAPKVCDNCSRDVEEGWTFCIHCGKGLMQPPPDGQ